MAMKFYINAEFKILGVTPGDRTGNIAFNGSSQIIETDINPEIPIDFLKYEDGEIVEMTEEEKQIIKDKVVGL